MDFLYWPDIARIVAFSIYGLILGLKTTFVYAMWKNREIMVSKYAWILRALYIVAHAFILTGFILLLMNRIGHHVPLNYPSFVFYYIGTLLTVWLLCLGIRTERKVSRFVAKGVYAEGHGPKEG